MSNRLNIVKEHRQVNRNEKTAPDIAPGAGNRSQCPAAGGGLKI